MSIQFINKKSTLSKLIFFSLCLGLISACATSPSTSESKDGPLSAQERLNRIKDTGSSKEPETDEAKNEQEKPDDVALEEDTAPEEKAKKEKASKKKAKEEFYDAAESSYTLPKAKKRLREQPIVEKEIKKSYKDALKTLDQGLKKKQFDDALQKFKDIEAQNSQLSGPSTNIGIIYLHQEKYKEAEKSFLKALEINNENEYAYNNLGLTYRELGNFPEAKKNYQEAIALNPKYAEAHYNLGVLAELYLHDLELAIQSFEHYKLAHRKKDQQVDTWLVDLKNRVNAEKQAKAKAAADAAKKAEQAQNPPVEEASPEVETTQTDQETQASETEQEQATEQVSPTQSKPQANSNPVQETTPENEGEKQ